MNFLPFGPFDVPRSEKGLIPTDNTSLKQFWADVDEVYAGVSQAVGCYIFSIRAGRGMLPWYVGLAEKQKFAKECFTPHKLVQYNEAIVGRRGTPVLTFLAKQTPAVKFSKPSSNGHRDIQFLETMLIGLALRRNSDLANAKDTKFMREMVVHGILNTPRGRRVQAVADLASLMGT